MYVCMCLYAICHAAFAFGTYTPLRHACSVACDTLLPQVYFQKCLFTNVFSQMYFHKCIFTHEQTCFLNMYKCMYAHQVLPHAKAQPTPTLTRKLWSRARKISWRNCAKKGMRTRTRLSLSCGLVKTSRYIKIIDIYSKYTYMCIYVYIYI